MSAALEHAQAAAGDQPRGEDFYVGRTGAVANPRGFDRCLADFIGWQMPQLPAGDGREAPLYMELGAERAATLARSDRAVDPLLVVLHGLRRGRSEGEAPDD